MTLHFLELNSTDYDVFTKSGAVNVKQISNEFEKDDEIFIRLMGEENYFGPFHVCNPEIKAYYGTGRCIWQILCEMRYPIRTWKKTCSSESIPHKDSKSDEDPYFTGSAELDGLLHNAYYDEKHSKYLIEFEKDVSELKGYYSNLLTKHGISNRIAWKKYLQINDETLCKKCLRTNLDPSSIEYISGYLAPRLFLVNGRPGRDATKELEKQVCIRNPSDELKEGIIENNSVVFFKDSYKKLCISSMCLKHHPIHDTLFGKDETDHQKEKYEGISKKVNVIASTALIESLFKMCKYNTNLLKISENIYHMIVKKTTCMYDILIVPTINEELQYILEEDVIPKDSFIIQTNESSPHLKIIKLPTLVDKGVCQSTYDLKGINLDENQMVPLEPALVREMKQKMDLIWST